MELQHSDEELTMIRHALLLVTGNYAIKPQIRDEAAAYLHAKRAQVRLLVGRARSDEIHHRARSRSRRSYGWPLEC
jgi:hypothetical protein